MRKTFFFALALILSGCATLPTSGPVTVGGPISVDDATEVEYLPTGPADGATQKEILDGFIAAAAAPQNNFRVARSFLTDDLAQTWNPARETIVRGIYSRVITTSANEMTYATTVNATVDETGVYTPVRSVEPVTIDVRFTRVNNEWRLSEFPDLSVVTEVAFDSAYDEYTAYFFNESRTALIPDVRVFARQGDPVTAVTRAVIAGPSKFLPNAVSVFPEDTTLTVAPVDTEGGRARVDLSDDATHASVDDQRAMVTELATSLAEFTDILSTVVTVGAVPLAVSPLPAGEVNPRVDDLPLVVRDGKFGLLADDTIDSIRENGARIANLEPVAVSFDVSSGVAAVGTRIGVYRVSDRTERVSQRPSLVEPQIDDAGSIWWVDPESPSKVSVFAGGATRTFEGPWPNSAEIAAVEISRENSRIAIAVNSGTAARLYVGAISIDESGRPTAVSGYRALPVDAQSIVDLTWVDSTNLALIGVADHVAHVEVVSVGGRLSLLGQPQNPTRIAGGNTGVAGLTVLSQNDQIWKPRGAGWQSTGFSADVLATQH